jgi:hypothetical protein
MLWPRTISTKASEGRQITVYSKQEALLYYKDSNYLDCRISAYNARALQQQTIDLLMIDLDLSNFKSNGNNNNIKALDLPRKRPWQRYETHLIYQKNLNLQL